ncbi:MAG: SprB repeat-containing protein [Bacteroidota bacterium]
MNRNLFATLITLCCFFVTHAQINIALDATAPSCDGFTDGRITATIEGGTAPYTYAWNTGANSSTIFSAPTGTYSLTVTDTDGTTATETIDLIAPAPLGIELSAGTSVCDGAATNYTVQATGGTAPYRYTWSNGQMGNTLNPAEEEVYYVTVEDANGCSNTFPVKIFQPLTVEVVTIGTRCPNFCDASAEAVIAGGFAPYTFSWNTGDTIQILETLPAGTYTVTVTDANGCVVVGTGVAEAASDIEFAVEVNGTCGSSSITANVNAEGGNGGIQIAWSTGNTGMMVEGLTPGETYSVTVTDVAGCTKREEFTVPNETGLVIDLEAQNLACGATTGGTATVTPLGGTAPYSIIWGNGELAVNTIEDLSVGEYCVTVIDANGCRGEQCVEITASQGLNLEVDSTPAICGTMPPDGMANVVPSGGTAPYVYAWNDGQSTGTAVGLSAGDYRVTVTDAAGCEGLANVTVEEVVDIEINATLDATSATLEVEGGTGPYTITWSNGQTGITAMDLVAGECYQVTITDANACTTQEEVCLPSTNVDFTFALTPDCNQTGGAATINIVGGIAPYNIEWVGVQNGGTSVDGLSPGNYTVVVTDSNGTQRTRFFDITSANLEVVANASAVVLSSLQR